MAYDINIQLAPLARSTGRGFYSFGQTRSLGVRGIQKLVNIFAKHLLTPVGSDPLDLRYGTNLMSLVGANVTLLDASEVIHLAVTQTVANIQAYQTGQTALPAEERLASAQLTNFLIIAEGPGVAAQILIQNVVNQTLQIILPTLEVRQ